ncbi:hypothetical protein F4777DRAFT_536182 [Nemania sp. FL0916]|nr:hypothetical protein F4777DRAFT_536182 [Nemania sp. FL0916]
MSSSGSSGYTDAAQRLHFEEQAAFMHSILNNAKALYDANTPLFTKDALRQVAQKLEACRNRPKDKQEITLQGIDGLDYNETIFPRPEEVASPGGEELHVGGDRWVIEYHAIEDLTMERDPLRFSPGKAYLSMTINICTRWLILDTLDEKDVPVSSTEELREVFRDKEQEWKMSEYYGQLQAALATVNTPLVLDKVIGVALGPPALGARAHHNSIIQHALLRALHSILSHRGILAPSSQCYTQDPMQTEQDKDILRSEGFTVLADPEAFLMLDDSSVLLSICPDIPVKQIVADICRPGIIIWSKHEIYSDLPILPADPESSRVERMLRECYDQVDFPFHEPFLKLEMYIKKAT